MRRSTLAALILGGGTLLSLPFRRDIQPDDGPDSQAASDGLDERSIEMLVQEITKDVQTPVVYHRQADAEPSDPFSTIRSPLTYEDLAVPLEDDPYYAQRFNAAADVAQRQREQQKSQRIAELERAFAATRFQDARFAPAGRPMAESTFSVATSGSQQTGSHAPPDAFPSSTPDSGASDGQTFGSMFGATVANDQQPPGPEGAQPAPSSDPPRTPRATLARTRSESVPSGSAFPSQPETGGPGLPARPEASRTGGEPTRERSILDPLPAADLSVDATAGERPRQWIVQPD
ncbi:hypothetical protein FYK55_23270 [Roseiconus nitratireducens]|uniref:Uncharacterized protein n=1 Tax=Roseiconus nitratireducens TaxID=2605748 RepID=A0A5M6D0A0_9BACT|nr:hypothetical protein [Roseiconus nitratireducens]KAA5539722.1 hypothetical protein FYK55_23270 [Roseiconus nitratireducens]